MTMNTFCSISQETEFAAELFEVLDYFYQSPSDRCLSILHFSLTKVVALALGLSVADTYRQRSL